MIDNSKYHPGEKPQEALAAIVHFGRVRREAMTPHAKGGLTLLAKRGLVIEYGTGWGLAPHCGWESVVCRAGLVSDDIETQLCGVLARRAVTPILT